LIELAAHQDRQIKTLRHWSHTRLSNVRVERAARDNCQAPWALTFPKRPRRPEPNLSRTAPTHS
jgi:hypothetical protein